MGPKVDFFEILRNENKLTVILVYPSIDRIDDPYEKTTTQTVLNSLPCEAYVIDEGFSSLKYKYFGELPYESKKILCHLEDVNLLKSAAKIQIKDSFYFVYKDADKNFAVLSRENYAVVVLARKPNA